MRRFRTFLRGRLFPCALLAAAVLLGGIALAIWLPRLLAPVAIAERAFSFAVTVAVLASREIPERKIAKLVLLLFLPWLGSALVLIFSETPVRPKPYEPASCEEGLFARVAALGRRMTGIAPCTASNVHYCAVGEEMGELLLRDLNGAKRRIYFEYYIVAQGVFFGEIRDILERKAAEGVDVRMIFDDFGCSFTLPKNYASELEAHGIKTAVFRRVKFGRGFSRRDHRKIAVIDDVCYTGGINLADEYVAKKIRFGHWKDSAVRIEGDVSAFSELFLRTWYALHPSERKKVPHEEAATGKLSYIALSDTTSEERLSVHLFPLLFSAAEHSLLLFTPYLSLPDPLFSALAGAAARGVDVRVMIPHIPDKKAVFFLSRAYARELERAGIGVREYTAGFLHAKSVMIDGKFAFVSSYNLDFRSIYVQAECGAFFEDAATAEALRRDFESCWEQGTDIKKANGFVRFLGRACMLFAPLT